MCVFTRPCAWQRAVQHGVDTARSLQTAHTRDCRCVARVRVACWGALALGDVHRGCDELREVLREDAVQSVGVLQPADRLSTLAFGFGRSLRRRVQPPGAGPKGGREESRRRQEEGERRTEG